MEKRNRPFLLFLMAVSLFSMTVPSMSSTVHAENKAPVEYVDPFIGTGVYAPDGAMSEANVFPGATTPNGMVQLSPDTGRHIAGYLYSDNHIEGFSFTHLSGTGCWGLGNFLSTATTGGLKTSENSYKSKFSHDQESASPGYYSVMLQDYDIQAELTATTRVGFLRYTFPESDTSRILLDASHTLEDDPVSDATIQIVDDETVVGSQTVPFPFCGG